MQCPSSGHQAMSKYVHEKRVSYKCLDAHKQKQSLSKVSACRAFLWASVATSTSRSTEATPPQDVDCGRCLQVSRSSRKTPQAHNGADTSRVAGTTTSFRRAASSTRAWGACSCSRTNPSSAATRAKRLGTYRAAGIPRAWLP